MTQRPRVAVRYEQVNGTHLFTSSDDGFRGLRVANESIERAYYTVAIVLHDFALTSFREDLKFSSDVSPEKLVKAYEAIGDDVAEELRFVHVYWQSSKDSPETSDDPIAQGHFLTLGDMATLKSGGPRMVVSRIKPPKDSPPDYDCSLVECRWFDETEPSKSQSEWFPDHTLVRIREC